MLKGYFICRCDFGEEWKIVKDSKPLLTSEDMVCVKGHEAITVEFFPFVDDVVITFIPAGVISNEVKNTISGRGLYYIKISKMDDTVERISAKAYSWKEAVEIAQRFDKRTFDEALKFWDMWKLGDFYSS